MTRHRWWGLLLAGMFSCSAVLAQEIQVEEVVPFKLYGQHLIVVQGTIGNLQKRNLVIDTGAYPSIIDRGIAKKLKLTGRDEELDAINRTVMRTAVTVPGVSVGPIQVSNLRSLVDDLSSVSERFGVRIDALIGIDVLSHSSFRIDYARQRMFFGPVLSLPFSAPFEIVDRKICLGLHANGQFLRVLVDTGAERTVLLRSRVASFAGPTQSRKFTNLVGQFTLREAAATDLHLGNGALDRQSVFLTDASNLPAYRFDGFLSTAQFQQFAFDFERQEFSWVTQDDRRPRVKVAEKPDPSSIAIGMERTPAGATAPEYCADGSALECALR